MTKQKIQDKKLIIKRRSIPSFSNTFSLIASVFLFALLLKNPTLTQASVFGSLKLCATLLIPSLFPLMVASEIAAECGAVERLTRPIIAPISKLLGISKRATSPFFLGLVGGYTTSLSDALSLYRRGLISKYDCERIIAYSSMPSLAFLSGFVGASTLGSSTAGCILWLICIASTIILALCERLFIKAKRENSLDGTNHQAPSSYAWRENDSSSISLSKILVNAISHSAHSMLIICACVVFFSTLKAALKFPLSELGMSDNVQRIILGALELTSGISECASLPSLSDRTALCAFFVGWSGLCVHFQIIALCDGVALSFKKYFIFKLLQGLLCLALAHLLL